MSGHRDPLRAIELQSASGLRAQILPYGARLAALWVPTRRGPVNVVLGHARAEDYLPDHDFLGCTIGRVSGRIAHANFVLEGRHHALAANEPPHHLHGGAEGFHAQPWTVAEVVRGVRPSVLLEHHSPAGAGGYPGALRARARFTLDADALSVELRAEADRLTPVSLTLHPYFNLGGAHDQVIDDHRLRIDADEILELDATLIPTGRRLPVAGTPFDFRAFAAVGAGRAPAHRQLRLARGFDHAFLLRPQRRWDAQLTHAGSGLTLSVESNQPSLQFYTGQGLRPQRGAPWGPRCGLCLEPQAPPNAVNDARLAVPWLRPGELYVNRIRYVFAGLEPPASVASPG